MRGLSWEQEHLQTWGSGGYSEMGAEGSRAQVRAGAAEGWGKAEQKLEQGCPKAEERRVTDFT